MEVNELIAKGIEALEQEKLDEALALALQIQKAAPKQSVGFHIEGLVHQSSAKWEESITALTKAIEQSPYDPALFNFRGFAYLNLSELPSAKADFSEAISLEDYEPAHRNMVLWMIVSNHVQEAIDYLTVRIQTKQEDPENFEMMGDLMMRVGMDEKAQTYYDVANALKSQA
ncbi:hypothetical protein EP331_15045 [bacterium]|nr:MAG: hypothetical protein EP331_15045 [bacterium]